MIEVLTCLCAILLSAVIALVWYAIKSDKCYHELIELYDSQNKAWHEFCEQQRMDMFEFFERITNEKGGEA